MLNVRRFHIICCSAYSLLCMAWRAVAGPGISWDTMHYHLYAGYAWWHNRLPGDFFAAGPQGYLNPFPHLPFYAAYQSGMPSLLVAMSMALLHSTNLWLLHCISCRLIRIEDRMGRLLVFCSVLLGAFSPAFQFEVGTSYTDVIVSIPVLGSFLLLLIWQERQTTNPADWRYLYGAGLLAGISMGLKPSMLVLAVALFGALWVSTPVRRWPMIWRSLISAFAGLVLAGGEHALMLWNVYGSPFFPLFNGIFESSWFPAVNVVSDRFRPSDIWAAVRFPWDMANSFKRVSFEGMVVDIRPMWILGLFAGIIVLRLLGFRPSDPETKRKNFGRPFFWTSLIIFFPIWIFSSGNIRYAVPFLLLLGIAIGLLAKMLIYKRHVWALAAVLLSLTAQAVLAVSLNTFQMVVKPSGYLEFDPKEWNGGWISVVIPDSLISVPSYYLSLQSQSFGSLAIFFPKESRFLNIISSTALPKEIVSRWRDKGGRPFEGLPVRTLMGVQVGSIKDVDMDHQIKLQNNLLSEYGYVTTGKDCSFIGWGNGKADLKGDDPSDISVSPRQGNSGGGILSCPVTIAPPMAPEELLWRFDVDRRIDFWAKKCPSLFYPSGFPSIQYPDARIRHFPALDMKIVARRDGKLIAAYPQGRNPSVVLENAAGEPLISTCPSLPEK